MFMQTMQNPITFDNVYNEIWDGIILFNVKRNLQFVVSMYTKQCVSLKV